MEDVISRVEHEAFAQLMTSENKRLEEENNRQNQRLRMLEQNVERSAALTTAVERLATNMESMLREQERQGKRLERLESRDGEMWRKVIGYIGTAIIGIVIGFIFRQLGM